MKLMACRREDVDIHEILGDPTYARDYVTSFNWNGPPPKQIVLSAFESVPARGPMSDEEAIRAARILLRDIEIPQIMKEKQLEKWEH